MSNVIQFPVIAGVEITTDEHGRFNLNALHRASGLGDHKLPSQWLRYDGTKALIAELEQSADSHLAQQAINSVKGGSSPGTFAVQQLAVAYANWISPKFYLIVIDTFLAVRKRNIPALPNFADPEEAALAWIEQFRETKRLSVERDEAIRTKALIGSKREATAMATAAAAIKRADKFAELAGDSKRFKQVKAIPWLLEVFAPSKGMYQQMGKLLGKISAELNYEVLKIEDSEYGQVKAYHVDVITEALCRIEYSDELMGKYRNSKVGEVA